MGRVPAASCSPTTRWAVGLSDGAAQLCLPHRGQNERGAISTASLRVRVCAEDSSCGCEVGGGSSRCGVGAVSAGLHSTAGCSEHRCLSLQVLSEQTDLRRWLWVVRLHTRTHGLPGEHTGMWLQLCMFRGVGAAGWGQCPAVPAALSCRTDGKRWRLLQIIHTDSNTVLGQNDTGFSCDGSSNTFRVMFKEPVEVLPNVNYTACATLKVPSRGGESRGGESRGGCVQHEGQRGRVGAQGRALSLSLPASPQGPDSHYGTKGLRKVIHESPTSGAKTCFTFCYAAGNNNGTSVEDGQIPEIIFYT